MGRPKSKGQRKEKLGVPPLEAGSGLRPFGVEPQASQAEPLVPNAEIESVTIKRWPTPHGMVYFSLDAPDSFGEFASMCFAWKKR